MYRVLYSCALLFCLASCAANQTIVQDGRRGPGASAAIDTSKFDIPFEKHVLDNGLEVILHVDDSDPVVAINLAVHVGSARETPGRTGFAHLFEHLLFLDSENLGFGGLDVMATRIGGSGTNGFTTNDFTTYFQSAPSDSLEKLIWAEAEKIGFFIQTVTDDVLDREREVVKNEKRENVDRQPYGRAYEIISEAMYPEDHPYHWQVIGSLEDLQAATLEDVRSFYRKWYGPENVTVSLAGDFDPDEALVLIEKYFGEIPKRGGVMRAAARPAVVERTQKLYAEDELVKLPMLTMIWPTVETGHEDAAPLSVLASYLGSSKSSPLYRMLVEQKQLSTHVNVFTDMKEIAGEAYVQVSANEGVDLDDVEPVVMAALAQFGQEGISEKDLRGIKTDWEVYFLAGLTGALEKAILLSEANLYYGDPSYAIKEFENYMRVSSKDVMRVFNKYIVDRNFIAVSIVPEDEAELAVAGATRIKPSKEFVSGDLNDVTTQNAGERPAGFVPTPSQFDRSIEPPFGPEFDVATPRIWRGELKNGIDVIGIENSEIPLVYFSLRFDAGRVFGDLDKIAVSHLTAGMLNRGTATKTPQELERALRNLGAEIRISAGLEVVSISGSTLARNFNETIDLAEEMFFEPRWDTQEFAILKKALANGIAEDEKDPSSITARELRELTYPEGNIRRYPATGDLAQLETITLGDLKEFYAAQYIPRNAELRVAGDVDRAQTERAFASFAARWPQDNSAVATPVIGMPSAVGDTTLYFYDMPGATQSMIRAWHPSIPATHPDYPKLRAINFLLGGAFTARLNQVLRVEKGYTYGAGSGFFGEEDRGRYSISTSVRADATSDSIVTIHQILKSFSREFTEDDLRVTKGALVRGQALDNETLGAKLQYLGPIVDYNYDDDYAAQQAEMISAMSLDEFKALADRYLRPDAMAWLIVGDAKTQLAPLKRLGIGNVVLLKGAE